MVPVGRFEVEATRQGRFARGERTRPIVATAPIEIVRTIPAVASSGKKEFVAISAFEKMSGHPVLCRRAVFGVIQQLMPLFNCRGTPAIVGGGSIVDALESGQVVGEAVITIDWKGTVFGELLFVPLAIDVGTPVVDALGSGLAPGEEVAIVLRRGGTYIACGPQQSTWQT